MRRGDFLKELAGSLFQTVKSVSEPFLSEDLQKVEDAADRVLGIDWYPFMKKDEDCPKLEMKFIGGKPVIVSSIRSNMKVLDGVCPECSNILMVTTLYSTVKCLNCEKDYNFSTNYGELQLLTYPIKLKGDTYFIEFQKA